ncbi:MAG: endonuclease III domain-containing protein [Candidatus Thorarchaeota archaeon]
MRNNRKRAKKVIRILDKAYADAPMTYLVHNNPFEMLIATILSANTADICINQITPALFEKYPDAHSMANARIENLIDLIRLCGTYNKKSVFIRNTARMIVDRHSGRVPMTMNELIEFPGVSRKTANVVLSVVYGINEGVVVDTHVMRVTRRLGLTEEEKNRVRAERNLMELLPQDQWYEYARLIGAHGRRTCSARKPRCDECSVKGLCPTAGQWI